MNSEKKIVVETIKLSMRPIFVANKQYFQPKMRSKLTFLPFEGSFLFKK